MPQIVFSVAGVDVFKLDDDSLQFRAGMACDCDGSPRAYSPPGGDRAPLDYLANAGKPGGWYGIVTDREDGSGEPFIQGERDPCPGYYVSSTSLQNLRYSRSDPRRYVNSEEIPFIVLPPKNFKAHGVGLGDTALVKNLDNGREIEAIYADNGPAGKIGEGSIALLKALGINSNPKNGGIDSRRILYTVFPNQKSPLWPLK